MAMLMVNIYWCNDMFIYDNVTYLTIITYIIPRIWPWFTAKFG